MTSERATNDRLDSVLLYGGPKTLFDEEGVPINKQMPHPDQVITTVNGAFNDLFTGEPNVIINANLAGGNATYALTLQGARNLQGRIIYVSFRPSNDGGVRFGFINLPVGFVYDHTGSPVPPVRTSMRFPTGSISCIALVFMRDSNVVQVQGDVTGYTFA